MVVFVFTRFIVVELVDQWGGLFSKGSRESRSGDDCREARTWPRKHRIKMPPRQALIRMVRARTFISDGSDSIGVTHSCLSMIAD
jgi:hypothetical protein